MTAPALTPGKALCLLGLFLSLPLLLVYFMASHLFAVIMWASQLQMAATDDRRRALPVDGYALITGASSGLGLDFARLLASQGYSLILVARRIERIEALAADLRLAHGVAVETIEMDLGADEACEVLFKAVTVERDLHVSILINNAGVGCAGTFADTPLSDIRKMLCVNARAPLELMHLFLQPMRAKGRGHILNISSTSSCYPVPFEAAYCGTKHLLTATSRSVNAELVGSGVSVTTISPGAVDTEFASVAGEQQALIFKLPFMVQSSEACARQSLDAMFRCRSHVIVSTAHGGLYYFGETVKGMIPERVLTSVVGLMFGLKF